jgi:hypothetical protein
MKTLLLVPMLILFFSCKEEKSSLLKENCISKNVKWLNDGHPHLREQFKAQETYIIQSTDSWSSTSSIAFEKYDESVYKLKAVSYDRGRFETERKLLKDEWLKVKSVFDSLNYWCAEPNFNVGTIDGRDVRIIGIKDSSTFYSILTEDFESDSILQSNKINLKKICLNFLNMGGLMMPQRPKIAYQKLNNRRIGIEVYSLNNHFSKSFVVFLDNKKIETKHKVAEIIISESDLGKFELKVKEVLINDVELSFEGTLNQYLLDINKNNK